jgi:UV DNA damage endonuclease
MTSYEIRLGYACLNQSLRDDGVFTNRSLKLETAVKKGIPYINSLIEKNIDDLFKIIIYNESHGIRFYRMSSDIFPHIGNPLLPFSNYDLDFIKDKIKMIGAYAMKYGHRLTMHPGQFVQLGSTTDAIVNASITDLTNQANFLKMLGFKPTDGSVLIIHGGGGYDSKTEALKRWEKNYLSIPKDIAEYICLENDENVYSVSDLLPFCEKNNIPFCIDFFHNAISKDKIHINKKLMMRIKNTWIKHGGIMKCHYSTQDKDKRRGCHSKTINKLPSFIFDIAFDIRSNIDIMLEVKDKEKSVFKIYHKYFNIGFANDGKIFYKLK